MFKYTKATLDILVNDCKKYAKIFKYVSLLTTLGLLIYQIIKGFINNEKLVYLNLALGILVVVYLIIDFIFDLLKKKTAKKITRTIYKWIKLITKAVTLGFTIYDIAVSKSVDGIQIILTTLMIIFWIVSVVFELIFEVVQIKAEQFMIAFQTDVEDMKKPITTVSNFVKKVTGREVEEKPVNPKKEKILNKLFSHIENRKSKDK